jgi:hypothetical protein
VPVLVVEVRRVRVGVSPRLVDVRVAVGPDRRRVMEVVVMPVVMGVGMLVLHRVVLVLVPMALEEVQEDSCGHEEARPPMSKPPERSPRASAPSAPMKGAQANTDPVRAAPKLRCASR